jgi:hypothetical protein
VSEFNSADAAMPFEPIPIPDEPEDKKAARLLEEHLADQEQS